MGNNLTREIRKLFDFKETDNVNISGDNSTTVGDNIINVDTVNKKIICTNDNDNTKLNSLGNFVKKSDATLDVTTTASKPPSNTTIPNTIAKVLMTNFYFIIIIIYNQIFLIGTIFH